MVPPAGSRVGTTPSATATPASSASATVSWSPAESTERSTTSPVAPAPRTRPQGTPGAHECTHGSAPSSAIAESTVSSSAEASGGCTTRCLENPEAVGTAPLSTAGSAGSSTCTTREVAPGTRRRTSRMWARSPSANDSARSRRAPWSESTRSPRGFSTVAANVHGPATWVLNVPS